MLHKIKYLPTCDLPYKNIKSATLMMAKLYKKCPSLVTLPNISAEETILNTTVKGMPGFEIKGNSLILKINSDIYEEQQKNLEIAFNSPSVENLKNYAIDNTFLEKFEQLIIKFKSPFASINILGPVALSQIISDSVGFQILTEKIYRKLVIQTITTKALWFIKHVREINQETCPIIILEDDELSQAGMLKRENEGVTQDIIIGIYSKIIEKLKSEKAIVGVQCFEKCDWQIPIEAGTDIISFNAYDNPNNISVIPDAIKAYLRKGGYINWAFVPVKNDDYVKNITIEDLAVRLKTTMENVFLAGVPYNLINNRSLISLLGGTSQLSVICAEKTIITCSHLANRIRIKTK